MATINTPRYQMQLSIAKLESMGIAIDFQFARGDEFQLRFACNDDNDYCIGIPKVQMLKLDLNSLPNFWKYDDVDYPVRGLTLATDKFKDKPMVELKFKIKR